MRRVIYNCDNVTTLSYGVAQQVQQRTKKPITTRLENIENQANVRPGRLEKVQAYFAKA